MELSCSAVLIVRDEEAVIEECLRSVRRLVDEVVVLDTGSRDRTRERAANAGARVFESPWRDDFAAARNEAGAHARGSWILSIDADERIDCGSRRDLIPLLAGDMPVAFRVWLRPGRLFTRSRHCRLFRNDPRIRFEGRIRESVLPSIRRLAGVRATSGPTFDELVADCDVCVEHQDDPTIRQGKHARDLRLLEQAIHEDRENALYWTDFGRALAGLGQIDDALNAWSRAIDLVRDRSAASLTDSLPYTDLMQQLPPTDARRRELLEEASARFPHNQLIVWLRASTLAADGAFAEAQPLLRGLASLGDTRHECPGLAYDRRIFGEFAYGALAACCAGLRRWDEAAEWYGRAAAAQPASVEYRVKRTVALRRSLQAAAVDGRDVSAP